MTLPVDCILQVSIHESMFVLPRFGFLPEIQVLLDVTYNLEVGQSLDKVLGESTFVKKRLTFDLV